MNTSKHKIKYNHSINLVNKKIEQYEKMNPNKNISYDMIKSFIEDVNKNNERNNERNTEVNNKKNKELQDKLFLDFCDVLDS